MKYPGLRMRLRRGLERGAGTQPTLVVHAELPNNEFVIPPMSVIRVTDKRNAGVRTPTMRRT